MDNIIKNINKDREEKDQVDDSHGLQHGLVVLCNVLRVLDIIPQNISITDRQKLLVKLVALLHDIDDHKYFPSVVKMTILGKY